jgi:hypothetical protein
MERAPDGTLRFATMRPPVAAGSLPAAFGFRHIRVSVLVRGLTP